MEHMARILDATYKVLEKPRDAEPEDIFIEVLMILNGTSDKPITRDHIMVMVSRITQLEEQIKKCQEVAQQIKDLTGELMLKMEV